jgi:hypothetical protein
VINLLCEKREDPVNLMIKYTEPEEPMNFKTVQSVTSKDDD